MAHDFFNVDSADCSALVDAQTELCLCGKTDHLFLIFILSYDVTSGSEITPCIKIDKPLVVYRFGNVMY